MHGGFIQAGPQRIASLQGLRNHAVATAPVQCFRTSAYASAMSLTPAVPSPPVTSLASPSAPYSIPLASARIHRNQAVSTPHSERATARELAGETKRDGGVQRAARPSQLSTSGTAVSEFFASQNWAQLGVSQPLIRALSSIGISRPSHIQAAAARALRATDGHVLIADHAGSGKTLAYLLPLLQRLREEEEAAGQPISEPNCPRLLVMTPTNELSSQVVSIVRALAREAPLRSLAVTGGHNLRSQSKNLSQGVDVVVGTPGRINELMAKGALQLKRCCGAVVLDEVDILLGDASAFAEQLQELRRSAPPSTRFVLVTATVPEPVFQQLTQREFPGMALAIGPRLHRPPAGLVEELVDCSGGSVITEETGTARKLDALQRALRKYPVQRTLVFCNKIEICRKVENTLLRSNSELRVLAYHAAIGDDKRTANLQSRGTVPEFLSAPNDDQRKVLVCTDRASRGVDTSYVQHVVLFDFPRDPSEYVRRVGRTARGASGQGVVSVLVLGRQVQLAKDVIDRSRRQTPIHRVPQPFLDSQIF